VGVPRACGLHHRYPWQTAPEARASPCRCHLLRCSFLCSQSQARQACQNFRKNREGHDAAPRQEGSGESSDAGENWPFSRAPPF
jgi:hypothetical protein